MAASEVRDPDVNQKIVIVGAGVFGLTTALHLAKRGYKDIHLFDYQPYHENSYACAAGCDGASCDENKILRASYGQEKLYQDLALNKAMPEWRAWNDLLSATPASDLPPGLTPEVKLWNNCGSVRLSDGGLEQSEIDTQKNFPKDIQHTQYHVTDEQRRRDAANEGIPPSKLDPFGRFNRGLPTYGVLDMTAGFVLASRACAFALHLCRLHGVQLHLGPDYGLQRLSRHENRIKSIITNNDQEYFGDLFIVACGGWTPSLLPEVEELIETTSGSVLAIQLPLDRPDLWEKYSPEKFAVWTWNLHSYELPGHDIGGFYGLPRTPEGIVKLGFRGAKWTNYARHSHASGKPISYPKTDVDEVPEEAVRVLRTFCAENLPDLLELDGARWRLCWYSDSVDNSFLIDYVPDNQNLIVGTGGSGHGFKFLPVLGEHVVDVIERKDTAYTRLFRWRDVPNGKRNGLEEGPSGWRTLDKHTMAGSKQWKSLLI